MNKKNNFFVKKFTKIPSFFGLDTYQKINSLQDILHFMTE